MKSPSIRRNNNRLPDFNYSQDGAYFITIVTQNRLCLFGSILDGKMVLNDAGRMVEQVCQEMPQVIRGVEISCFQIMSNHFHAIIWIKQSVGAEEPKLIGTLDVGADLNESPQGSGDNLDQPREAEIYKYNDLIVGADLRVCPGQPQRVAPTNTMPFKRVSLSNIVQRFKSLITRRYIECVRHYGWPPFHKRLWQRNYYEHVIRDEKDLESITDYILQNPQNWESDEEYP